MDGAVAGELVHAGGIEDGHFGPAAFVGVGLGDFLLRVAVGAEVGEAEVGVAAFEEAALEGAERAGFVGGEVVGADPIDDGAQFLIGLIVGEGAVAAGPECLDLVDGEAEDEDVVGADFLEDFDVGAVEGADGERAVEGELHVAGAGGFLARGGDLLGDIGGGDDALGERDAVVGEEDDLEFVADARVVVDLGADGVDRLDDALGEVVAGSGLGGEDEDAGRDFEAGVLQEAAVEGEDVEQVEVLPLVLVQALDLHVEKGVGVDDDTAFPVDDLGEIDLVGVLDGHEGVLKAGVVGELFESTQLFLVLDPAVAELGGDQFREAGVGGLKPAAGGDAVGLVVELAGIKGVEIGEEMFLEQFRVEGGDAVDGVAADDGEIGHADHLHVPFLDERHDFFFVDVAGVGGLDGFEQAAVDFEDELQVTGQDFLEEGDAPFLERFGEQRVVGVGEGPGDNVPGCLPRHAVFVMENAEEFDDGDGGVGVVELDGDLGGEFAP